MTEELTCESCKKLQGMLKDNLQMVESTLRWPCTHVHAVLVCCSVRAITLALGLGSAKLLALELLRDLVLWLYS